MRMKDYEHPFFRPLWRRIAIVAVCLAWSGLEFAGGSPMWGMIALGFTAYAVWQFFYLYKPAETGPVETGPVENGPVEAEQAEKPTDIEPKP